jgi:hypothetical protein
VQSRRHRLNTTAPASAQASAGMSTHIMMLLIAWLTLAAPTPAGDTREAVATVAEPALWSRPFPCGRQMVLPGRPTPQRSHRSLLPPTEAAQHRPETPQRQTTATTQRTVHVGHLPAADAPRDGAHQLFRRRGAGALQRPRLHSVARVESVSEGGQKDDPVAEKAGQPRGLRRVHSAKSV